MPVVSDDNLRRLQGKTGLVIDLAEQYSIAEAIAGDAIDIGRRRSRQGLKPAALCARGATA